MGIVGRVWDYFLAMLQIATLVTLDDQAVLQVPGHPLSVINTPFWSVLQKDSCAKHMLSNALLIQICKTTFN